MPDSLILAATGGYSEANFAFPVFILVFWAVMMTVVVAAYGIGIWALVDAARRPNYQYAASGQSKELWIILPVVGLVACQPVAIVAGLIFLLSIRKKLNAVPVPPPNWYGSGPNLQPGWYGPGPPTPPGWYGAYPPPARGFNTGSGPAPWAAPPGGGRTAGPTGATGPTGPWGMPGASQPEGGGPVRQADFAPPTDQRAAPPTQADQALPTKPSGQDQSSASEVATPDTPAPADPTAPNPVSPEQPPSGDRPAPD